MSAETLDLRNFARFWFQIDISVKLPEPFRSQMHHDRFMRQTVFGVIDDRRKLVPRDQENVARLEYPGLVGLDDFRFPGHEPNEHVAFEHDFRLEKLVFVARKLDVGREVFRFVFHLSKNTVLVWSEGHARHLLAEFPEPFRAGFV